MGQSRGNNDAEIVRGQIGDLMRRISSELTVLNAVANSFRGIGTDIMELRTHNNGIAITAGRFLNDHPESVRRLMNDLRVAYQTLEEFRAGL